MLPHATVAVDDLLARLALRRPHVGATLGGVVPPGQGLRKRPVEDLAEIPRLPDRQVLDQAKEIGSSQGQGTADVALRQPFELPQHRLADLTYTGGQVVPR